MCKVELGEYEAAEPILKDVSEVMAKNNDKRERKFRYNLAKIAAAKREFDVAIEQQSRAVQISKESNDSSLEQDLKYLKELKQLLNKD